MNLPSLTFVVLLLFLVVAIAGFADCEPSPFSNQIPLIPYIGEVVECNTTSAVTFVGPIVATFDGAGFLAISQLLASPFAPAIFTSCLFGLACLCFEAHDNHSLALLLDSVDSQFRSIVASRSGPTPTLMIGNPSKLSIFSTYSLAFSGSDAKPGPSLAAERAISNHSSSDSASNPGTDS